MSIIYGFDPSKSTGWAEFDTETGLIETGVVNNDEVTERLIPADQDDKDEVTS